MYAPLPRSFYKQDLHFLAIHLLGSFFVRIFDNGKRLSGRVVEVEAYAQEGDPSAHSFNGISPRNEVMFGAPGHLYVYFTYGLHYCCNVVAGEVGQGNAVLIRAVEPIEGIDEMLVHRYGASTTDKNKILNVTNGPAKLCQAFGIDRSDNGIDLCHNKIFIEAGSEVPGNLIGKSTRIGINQGKELPWRYFIKNNNWVSKPGKGIEYFG
ncbi:MAG: DNA-3-methyladenine glycosylase [Candidatus Marinimicrobia bacterium]|nr:DNA-3-methyladenine glycosylase [Candidatus Neomarinimicrobiota bacterium]